MVRAFFGIAMGGIYGNCAATALEDAPKEARGILSGMLQQGYAFGYLLAAVFARGLAHDPVHHWRPLFWFGACPPVLIIIWRLCLPETNAFLARKALLKEAEGNQGVSHSFVKEAKVGLKRHWMILIYLVLLMAGMNFMVSFREIRELDCPMLILWCAVAWLPGPLPYPPRNRASLLSRPNNGHPSGREPRCNVGRHSNGLLFATNRSSHDHHRCLRRRRSPSIPLYVPAQQQRHGGRLL